MEGMSPLSCGSDAHKLKLFNVMVERVTYSLLAITISGGFRGVARGAIAPFLKSQEVQ